MVRLILLLMAASVAAAVVAACGDNGGPDDGAIASSSPSALPADPGALMSLALRISFLDVRATVESDPDPAAVEAMGESGDEQYIPVLIDILRFPWLLDEETETAVYASLAKLSGGTYGDLEAEQLDWVWWAEWLASHPEVEPPEGYARWKGNLLTQLVDVRTGAFLVGAEKSTIRLEEIVWGGVPRDGIPDLQMPPALPADQASYMNAGDRVFGVSFNGESRAYPLRIMNAHEMANDEVGGVHFVLAYCTLCGSGIAYATEVNGEVLSFGTSGLLYRSNKLMYDRGTKSLWNQFGGNPVVGDLAGSGVELEVLPVTLTTWSDWLAQHPETTVLSIETGLYPASSYEPEDDPNSIYYEYRNEEGPIFPVHERSDLLAEKELVMGVNIEGEAKAYPVSKLEQGEPVNDSVGGAEVIVIATGEAGAAAYERDGLTFTAVAAGVLTDDLEREWAVEEQALVLEGDPSQTLPRLESRIAYWFAWYQFHPLTDVYD